MTYHAPASAAAQLFRTASRHLPDARRQGPLLRMLLKIAVLSPLVVAAFALRYAAFS